MNHFSDIGFNVRLREEFGQLLEKAYRFGHETRVPEGVYSVYTDYSGAQLFVQINKKNEFIGGIPHFKGKSKRVVCLTGIVKRSGTALDGAFKCWANPARMNIPHSGQYPFVFDLPDFKMIGKIEFPKNFEIQLTAFAESFNVCDDEKEFFESQTSKMKFATQSFIPSGMFTPGGKEINPPEARGIFTGIIRDWSRKTNEMTGQPFYWLLVDTLGGEVDVVADPEFFKKEPKINGIVKGTFWLSGRLLHPPKRRTDALTFLRRLFGRAE